MRAGARAEAAIRPIRLIRVIRIIRITKKEKPNHRVRTYIEHFRLQTI